MPIRITGLNSGLDTDSIVQELVSAYRTKQEKYVKEQTKLEWKQDSWKDMNTKIYGFYSKKLWNMTLLGSFTGKKKTTVSDSTKATISADSSVVNGTQTLKVNQLATAGYLTGTELKKDGDGEGEITSSTTLSELGVKSGTLKLEVGGETKTVEVKSDMKISDFVSALKEQGVSANFDSKSKRLFVQSAATGEKNDFNFVADNESSLEILKGLGLATHEQVTGKKPEDLTEEEKKELKNYATKADASDAEIELNGAVFRGDSNTFSINGLNITATGVSDMMTISTATDVDGIYGMIKDFFSEYNSLMNSMEAAYNAKSSKGYEPLSSDEKGEMSDDEVEKWEKKIKDSLLRRDDTLRSVMSSMSMSMSKTYEINGKKYSLSSFGINTSGYFTRAENESYAYHIDGDEDDIGTSGSADRLRKAIEEDPDAVASFFNQLSKDLYDTLGEKMGKTELSSSYTVYNDIQMKNEYDEYTKTIKKWEEKLKDMEDRYYKQFSAMETALAKLQSQTNSLASLLGG